MDGRAVPTVRATFSPPPASWNRGLTPPLSAKFRAERKTASSAARKPRLSPNSPHSLLDLNPAPCDLSWPQFPYLSTVAPFPEPLGRGEGGVGGIHSRASPSDRRFRVSTESIPPPRVSASHFASSKARKAQGSPALRVTSRGGNSEALKQGLLREPNPNGPRAIGHSRTPEWGRTKPNVPDVA